MFAYPVFFGILPSITSEDATMAHPAELDRDPAEDLFGHPKGLYVCFFTEMWERFSFYGMKALLALYLIKHHGFSDTESLTLIGAYGGLAAHATPVLGGIRDRFLGMRKAVILGGVLLCLGHLGMAVEGHQATMGADGVVHRDVFALGVFYLSLALIISGVVFEAQYFHGGGQALPRERPPAGFGLYAVLCRHRTWARCSRRSSAATWGIPTAGAMASARRVLACWQAWLCSLPGSGTCKGMPSRPAWNA